MTNYERISAENREFWANLPKEDKRYLKKFGAVVFIMFILTLWAENYFHGVF